METDRQRSVALDEEQGAFWYLGGLRIIQALEGLPAGSRNIFEYHEPAGTRTSSYSPSHEDTAFYLIEGEVVFVSGEITIHAIPGTFLFLPRPIGFRSVVISGPARILTWTTPMGFVHHVMQMEEPGQAFVLMPPSLSQTEQIQQFALLLRNASSQSGD